ncbi:MAG: tetratricopeptide repeat protein [Saprospiraceae bacterium]|jgi:tetratricopeptide (TPR) repeat protein|nr:tetratricopeptide repeat protein [Saprospiraceae bacterium]
MIRSFFLPILFIAGLFFTACNQDGNFKTANAGLNSEEIAASIPALLDRNEAIRNGKEWDDVQNFYGTQRQAIIADKNALEPRLKLAELFIQEARVTGEHPHYYPAALQMLEEVLNRIPQADFSNLKMEQKDLLFRALAAKASVQLSLHDFSNALETATKAVAINPHNAQIYGALVDANVELGNYDKAVEMADKMVSIRPDLRSYSRVAYLREIFGDVNGAAEALEMAIKAGMPGQEATAWARLTLGNLYRTYGDWNKAEMQYQMILAERADYPFAIAALGEVEMHKKNYGKAEASFKKAASIIPEVGFYEQLAELYKMTGRTAEYEALVPEILNMMQEDMDKGHNMSLELACLHTDLQPDYDKALQYALREYQKRPANIDVNRLLAKVYAGKKDVAKAKAHIAKAAVTRSKHPELLELKKMMDAG